MGEWKSRPIQSLCSLFTDGDWIETKNQSKNGIRLVQTGNVGAGEFKDRRDKARWISSETFKQLNCQEILPGDCLISRLPDPVGRACLIPATGDRMITAVDCTILRFEASTCIPEYFCYFSQTADYLRDVESKCTGATRKRISRKNLGKVHIPLPPLAEQERIVAILDEVFSGLQTATANTEKNLANARELFDSYLDSALMTGSQSWQASEIIDVCALKSGTTVSKSLEHASGDLPYVKVADMALPENCDGIRTSSRFLDHKDVNESKVFPIGTVIFPKRGGAIATNKKKLTLTPICADLNIMGVIPGPEILPEFLFYYFARFDLSTIGSGASIPQINNYDIAPLSIQYPSLNQQQRIVDSIYRMQTSINRVATLMHQKRTALAELKQSILQKAFSGALTAHPDRALSEAGA